MICGKRFVAFGEIFLLVSLSFAFSFLISENFVGVVSAQTIAETHLQDADANLIRASDVAGRDRFTPSPPKTVAVNPSGFSATPTPAAAQWITQAEITFPSGVGTPTESIVGILKTTSGEGYALTNVGDAYAVTIKDGTWTASGARASLSRELQAQLGGIKGINPTFLQAQGWESLISQSNPAGTGLFADGSLQKILLQPGDSSKGIIINSDGSLGSQISFSGPGDGSGTWSKVGSGPGPAETGGGFLQGTGPGTLKGLFGGSFWGTGSGVAGFFSSLTTGLIWGGIVYGAVTFIGNALGFDEGQVKAAALGAGAGVATWQTLNYLGTNGVFGLTPESFLVQYSGLIGIGIGVAIFVLTYEEEKVEIVQFTCEPWQPPTGGNRCEECNNDPLIPCSRYRCQALGQACGIVNEGTEEELCVWTSPNDVIAPVITPLRDALSPSDLIYQPEGNGFRITQQGAPRGCLEAFTRLEFGVETNEPSQCRIDLQLRDTFEEMVSPFGNSVAYSFEHVQGGINTLDPALVDSSIHNDGTFTYYVRCRDANGNGEDNAAIPFRFCVQSGPDTKPPIIEGFSIPDGSPVSFEVDTVGIEVFVNEPADCRWSRTDESYESMDNIMTCQKDNKLMFNADLNFICSGELTGIQDRQDNKFYFACEDRPGAPDSERNTMRQSVPLTLRGTEPLVIQSFGPEGEIRGSTSTVLVNLTVETAFGANGGAATCFYEIDGIGQFNIAMDETGGFKHSQQFPFNQEGNHIAYYQCRDGGNNIAEASTSFNVVVDTAVPLVSRVYKDGSNLKVITNEDARCVYSLNSCSYEFASGLVMSYESAGGVIQKDNHIVGWSQDKTYYIKCEDLQGKRVAPDSCSLVVKGAEF